MPNNSNRIQYVQSRPYFWFDDGEEIRNVYHNQWYQPDAPNTHGLSSNDIEINLLTNSALIYTQQRLGTIGLSWLIFMASFPRGEMFKLNFIQNENHFMIEYSDPNSSLASRGLIPFLLPSNVLHGQNFIRHNNYDLFGFYRVPENFSGEDVRSKILTDICPVHPCGLHIARKILGRGM